MIFIRSTLFNLYLWSWTAIIATLGVPLLCFAPPQIVAYVNFAWSKGVLLGLRVLCNIRHEITGLEHIPADGTAIFASKHQSAWDTVIFLSILRRPIYVLKRELLYLPFYGWYLKTSGMIAVNRKAGASAMRSMIKQAKKRLEQGRPMVIFPEGTRTHIGEKKPYQPGIAALYGHEEITAPLIPVALNSGKYWARNAYIKKPGVIKLEFLPAIDKGLKKREFLAKLEETIETASEKLE